MLADLHVPHPSPSNLVICPTSRADDGLALSSRNAYLLPHERPYATALYRALAHGRKLYEESGERDAGNILREARRIVEEVAKEAKANDGVEVQLDFVSLNDPVTLNEVEGKIPDVGAVFSGAMWLGEKRTRLIDNVLLGVNLS
jgi:pantoate--beta-alanine ligase